MASGCEPPKAGVPVLPLARLPRSSSTRRATVVDSNMTGMLMKAPGVQLMQHLTIRAL